MSCRRVVITAIFCALLMLPIRAVSLVWTPQTNHVRAVHLLTNLVTEFKYTNSSSQPVVITEIERSCHCTTPQTPKLPWTIAPHSSGKMEVVVEIPGKWGLLRKTLTGHAERATNVLFLEVEIPEPEPREKNRLTAFGDRQAVFKDD